jgi:hypothetical protein
MCWLGFAGVDCVGWAFSGVQNVDGGSRTNFLGPYARGFRPRRSDRAHDELHDHGSHVPVGFILETNSRVLIFCAIQECCFQSLASTGLKG